MCFFLFPFSLATSFPLCAFYMYLRFAVYVSYYSCKLSRKKKKWSILNTIMLLTVSGEPNLTQVNRHTYAQHPGRITKKEWVHVYIEEICTPRSKLLNHTHAYTHTHILITTKNPFSQFYIFCVALRLLMFSVLSLTNNNVIEKNVFEIGMTMEMGIWQDKKKG